MTNEKIYNQEFYYAFQESGKISYEYGSTTEIAFTKRGKENIKENHILLFRGKEAGFWIYLEVADIFLLEFNGRGMKINGESCNLQRHILYNVSENNYRLAMNDEHKQYNEMCESESWWHPKSKVHNSERMELCLIGVCK